MIGYYNYTVILTYIGAASGFAGIAFACFGNLKAALFSLLFSGLCDMFDGMIASTHKKRTPAEKLFGIQIDSMSDLICFGVLPAAIVLCCAGKSVLFVAISAVYMLCALIRLSWFNVDEAERQGREAVRRKKYLGMPVTTASLYISGLFGFGGLLSLPVSVIAPWFLLCVGASFLIPFKMPKPGLVGQIIIGALGVLGFFVVLFGVQ